jgi:CHAT domain-containing protein/tetratricopeptide (TPR) repeat protein
MNHRMTGVVALALCLGATSLGSPDDPARGDSDEAGLVEEYHRMVARYGADDPQAAVSLRHLANFYGRTGRDSEAEPLLKRALAIYQRSGADPKLTADALALLGQLYRRARRVDDAVRAFRGAAEAEGSSSKPDRALIANCREQFVRVLSDAGRWGEAATLLSKDLRDDEARLDPDDPSMAAGRKLLAKAFRAADRPGEAADLLMENLLALDRQLGPDRPGACDDLISLASVQIAAGRFFAAQDVLGRASRLAERSTGSAVGRSTMARVELVLGHLCYAAGRYDEADQHGRQALPAFESGGEAARDSLALCLFELGWAAKAVGRYVEAEDLHRRALALRETSLNAGASTDARRAERARDVAASLNGLAALAEATGRVDEAERDQLRSLEILRRQLGPDHPEVATGLAHLAALHGARGRFAEAERESLESLRIREGRLGPAHASVGRGLDRLGGLYLDQGRVAEAEASLRRAVTILEASEGRAHPHVAAALAHYSRACAAASRLDQAEKTALASLRIREGALAPDHPDLADGLVALAVVHARQGRWAEAASEVDRARKAAHRFVTRTLPAMAEPDQLAFLRALDRPSFASALSIALARPSDPSLVALSAGWVLNGKAVALEALSALALATRDSDSPGRARALEELLGVRSRLAASILASPEPGDREAHRLENERLADAERELSRRLEPAGPDQGSAGAKRWVDLDAVRRALPGDTVLIEVARFDATSLDDLARPRAPRYAAWIIPSTFADGPGPQLVDLGPAARVDASVARVKAAIDPRGDGLYAGQRIEQDGEPAAESEAREALRALATLVIDPLLAGAGRARRWVISPDGPLWQVPWAALVLPDGRYLVEAHTLWHVNSGRSLSRPPAKAPPASAPIILANPDFDAMPGSSPSPALLTIIGRPADRPRLRARGLQARPLEWAAREAAAIAPLIRRNYGTAPLVLTAASASESAFKRSTRPRIAVFSTHGFADEALDSESRADNPLARCALLLAGSNRGAESEPAPPGQDDGLLTGLEVIGVDLRGTELVVLSACQTGLGVLREGEGAAGLRHAFHIAGAEAVVASLWTIDDQATARLMEAMFAELRPDGDKAEALRQAQLATLATRRRKRKAAHPYYWASFAISGKSP